MIPVPAAVLLIVCAVIVAYVLLKIVCEHIEGIMFTRKMLRLQTFRSAAMKGLLFEDRWIPNEDESVFAPLADGLRCGEYFLTTTREPMLAIEYAPEAEAE